MRAVVFCCLLTSCCLLTAASQQLAVPEFHQRVIDETSTLSPDELRTLESSLEQFERETSNQVVVLMIPSLQGESLEEYTLRVAEKNKFGKKERNNGVLLLIAKEDRKLRIEVGYGLEGALTDALSSQIIRREITPLFREGEYYAGISAGVNAIIAATKGEYKGERNDRKGIPFAPIAFVATLALIFLSLFFRRRHHYIGRSGYSSRGPFWFGGMGGGGGFGGGSFGGGGGGFSGGGGSFGGGGSSGSW